MFSLKLAVCVCILFTIGIEAAPEPTPWCAYPPCYPTHNRGSDNTETQARAELCLVVQLLLLLTLNLCDCEK